MAEAPSASATTSSAIIDFERSPAAYRHWKLSFDGEVAELIMDVDENATLFEGYQLKLNSYDLGVDIDISFNCHLDQASVCRIAIRGDRPILQTFNETAPLPNP